MSNVDNGKTLGFIGYKEIRYADVTSGGEGITIIVRVTGEKNSRIPVPLFIFKNQDRNYPIRGVVENVPGVSYRTGPKGWVDQTMISEWLSESRVINSLSQNRVGMIFVDNCSGHNMNYSISTTANTKSIRILHTFSLTLQNLRSHTMFFIIEKIKCARRKCWDEYKLSMIQQNV